MAPINLSGMTFPEPESFDAAPPPDPAALREQTIADNTRVEEGLNRFMNAKQAALFEAPDAFYRTQGSDAIHAAPVTTQKLDDLRTDLLDGLANDNQRQKLGDALDAQMHLTRQNMARHVSEQSLAWQRQTAQDRIATLIKEAAYHHNDDHLVDAIGNAAATAARAHARVGDTPVDADTEDAAAAKARSRVLNAVIRAHLDRGNSSGAAAQFDRLKDQLDSEHAEPLQAQLDTAQRFDAAKDYAGTLVPLWSGTHKEVDAQHGAATEQNQIDHQADPELQADVQHVLDVQHAMEKRGIDDAATQRNKMVADWLARKGPNGESQTSRPSPDEWERLTRDEQAALDTQLAINARGTVPDIGDGAKMATQDPNVVKAQFNSGEAATITDQVPEKSVSVGRSGTAPPTEPPSNSIELEHDFEQMQGRLVRLPDGSLVPNTYSDSGYLMSPFSDLSDVAAAGKQISARVGELMGNDILRLPSYIQKVVKDAVGQGGTWDYQRRHYAFGKDGFTQLRQFRDVANFNVGLYCQQAGIPLPLVLFEAGRYAAKNSKNAAPDQSYGLEPRTREQIELGYKIGQSGVFNSTKH